MKNGCKGASYQGIKVTDDYKIYIDDIQIQYDINIIPIKYLDILKMYIETEMSMFEIKMNTKTHADGIIRTTTRRIKNYYKDPQYYIKKEKIKIEKLHSSKRIPEYSKKIMQVYGLEIRYSDRRKYYIKDTKTKEILVENKRTQETAIRFCLEYNRKGGKTGEYSKTN